MDLQRFLACAGSTAWGAAMISAGIGMAAIRHNT